MLRVFAKAQTAKPPATVGTAPIKQQVIHFINKKMPGGLPKKTARALLDIEDADYVPIIRNPQTTTSESEAVFYFPGCGSERLFSQVGLATQAMLWHAGVQTVLPPGYLCCGYPQRGSGQADKAEKNHHRQPGAVPPRCQHAELSGHQNRGRELRYVLRPVAGLRVRQDISGLPHHRHP
jgi:Fe-S oxidoreductase